MIERKSIRVQAWVLFAVILANFVAQVPYFFHLYYGKQSLSETARSFVILGCVFAFFLAASWTFFRGRRAGYALMLAFLAVEFLFYLWGAASSVMHGFGLFFQVHNPDWVLRVIYSIGYLNLIASGYFIFLLLTNKGEFERPG